MAAGLIIFIIVFFFLLDKQAASESYCQTKCGDIEIPYPFGIGDGCYLDRTFEVLCDETTGSASLAWLSWDLDSISISDHTFRHKNFTGVTMRFDQAGKANWDHAPAVISSHYSLSHEHNTFIAMGCDFFVSLVDEDTGGVQGSCSSLCNNINGTMPASQMRRLSACSGLDCCQIRFPVDLRNLSVRVETMKSWKSSNAGNRCSFFTFVDNELLRTNAVNVSPCNDSYVVPMIHGWAVGDRPCREAEGRRGYLCGRNTDCIDYNTTSTVGRYRCRCSNGFHGNPYQGGCQDIDECADPRDNNCPSENRCVNTAGSYFCVPSRNRMLVLFLPLGIGLAVGILTLAALTVLAWRKLKEIKSRNTKQKLFKRNGGLLLQQHLSSSSSSTTKFPEMTIFTMEELDKATHRFSSTRILGRGGLGTVYKAMLSNGTIVAVKKPNLSQTDSPQFINEIFILSQINHRHIVKLLGCCLEAQVPLLVYEYVPNGTLSDHLHTHDHPFPWEKRLSIAAQVAEALAYMHSYATNAVFHRDIKSSNILLDKNYNAVLSDFGLSRSVSVEKTHLTTMVGGTFGYMDPQYFWSGRVNDKSDVYGFGVVVAEILTGQKAVSDDDQGLAMRFRSAVKEERLFEILDRGVEVEGVEEEDVRMVATLARKCLKMKGEKRPSMKEVAAGFQEIITRNRGVGYGKMKTER